MTSFSESALEKKLTELNNSQQSIQTLSLWLIHHRKHHKMIVQVWYRDLLRAKLGRKLTFLYLANDVIQNSKKKGPEFTKEFANVLAKALHHVCRSADEKTLNSLHRLLTIWLERGVYTSKQIEEFRSAVGSKEPLDVPQRAKKPKTDLEPTSVVTPSLTKSVNMKEESPRPKLKEQPIADTKADIGPPQDPPEVDVLVKALLDLENTASSDAAVREKIASLPPEVSDVTLLDRIHDRSAGEKLLQQVSDACALLVTYNGRLTAELEERRQVARMLSDFIAHQKAQLLLDEKKMEEFQTKLQRVTQVRSELKSHIQNLPDLTLLPDVTGGLAPLPSAGDLFNLGDTH